MAPDPRQLTRAAEELETAAGSAHGEDSEEISEIAAEFERLADEESAPDHSTMDERLNTLRQLGERTDGETSEAIDRALAEAESYREELTQN